MFIPVGTYEQGPSPLPRLGSRLISFMRHSAIWRVDKDAEGNVSKEKLFGVRVSQASGSSEGPKARLIFVVVCAFDG